jgi:hypothetical protein
MHGHPLFLRIKRLEGLPPASILETIEIT